MTIFSYRMQGVRAGFQFSWWLVVLAGLWLAKSGQATAQIIRRLDAPDSTQTDSVNQAPAWRAASGKPSTVFELLPGLLDFGDLPQGRVVQQVFRLRNKSPLPQRLTRVVPSCGCVVAANWSTELIPPGDTTQITAYFNSFGRMGPQEKEIQVFVQSSPAPAAVLQLRGTVVAPVKP
jgi:hypothetical protein